MVDVWDDFKNERGTWTLDVDSAIQTASGEKVSRVDKGRYYHGASGTALTSDDPAAT